jgi:poly(3-hydroxybutyrate) depolymerase
VLYHFYEYGHAAVSPARAAVDNFRSFVDSPLNMFKALPAARSAIAACEVFERTTRRYPKPDFGIGTTLVDGRRVGVAERVVWETPFARLVHFERRISASRTKEDPKILLVAPMSGHHATLLRGTVETFLPTHDVYITDWVDARDIPLRAGQFDLDDYIDTIQGMFRFLKGDMHVFAVCQPSVPVLAATALMEADNDPCVPRSLILAGGPVDTRISPTAVNNLAVERGVEWFRRNVLHTVPWPSSGAGRKVYPGFLQLTGFMTMNLDRHINAHQQLYRDLVDGDEVAAEKHREFYDEYLAVMDLTAEFYMQTIEKVFVDHELPRGVMMSRNRKIDLKAIRRPALMTVEGEKDDITGKGQCSAALDLCKSIPQKNKQHFECPGVGHYGVFNGTRFRSAIAPRMRDFMLRFDRERAALAKSRAAKTIVPVPHDHEAELETSLHVGLGGEPQTQASAAVASTSKAPAMFDPMAAFRLWSDAGRSMMVSLAAATVRP